MENELGRKIRERRIQLGLSQEALGERVNMVKLTISRYEGGKRSPGFEELTLLAQALEVAPSYFWSGVVADAPQGPKPGITRIPLLPIEFAVCCGRGNGYQEGLMTANICIDVAEELTGNTYDELRPVYAVRAEGNSMTGAGIHEGNILIINPADDAPTGCVALVRVGDNFMVKRIQWRRDGGVTLLSDGKDVSNYEFSREDFESGYVQICGRVTGIQSKM